MKVFVIQSGQYDSDGTARFSITSQRQINSLKEKGLDVAIGLVTSRTSFKGIKENIQRIRQEIRNYNPDVVHAHYGSVVGFVARKAVANAFPFVTSFCGDDLLGTPNPGITWRFRESISRFLSLQVAKKSTTLIVKSKNLALGLPNKFRSKATIIPNGVDHNFFDPIEKTAARKTLNWNGEPVIFFNGSSGSNAPVKNLPLAKATIEKLQQHYPKARLEMVSNVSPEELKLRMCASECVLVTSLHEGSPNIVKEALACNIPIVSVDCGDVVERLHTVNKGGVFPYNAVELAKGIKQVIEDQNQFNGRALFINQGLPETQIAEQIIQVYKQAIQSFSF